jgi:Xaa-Pro aminopeptidase
MQYSPRCGVPYVSLVDAGTVELVRSCGVEVVTSANLVQLFEAVWTPQQYASHKHAATHVDEIRRAAFARVADSLGAGARITEYDVQQFIRQGRDGQSSPLGMRASRPRPASA